MGNCVSAWLTGHSNDLEREKQEEMEREEGRKLLRSLVVCGEQVDWAAVIELANELHTREQAILRRRSRRQMRLQKQYRRKMLAERRKFDEKGSFSINLLTLRPNDQSGAFCSIAETDAVGDFSSSTISTRDDQSCDSINALSPSGENSSMLYKTWEEGMTPIDEQEEVDDTL